MIYLISKCNFDCIFCKASPATVSFGCGRRSLSGTDRVTFLTTFSRALYTVFCLYQANILVNVFHLFVSIPCSHVIVSRTFSSLPPHQNTTQKGTSTEPVTLIYFISDLRKVYFPSLPLILLYY